MKKIVFLYCLPIFMSISLSFAGQYKNKNARLRISKNVEKVKKSGFVQISPGEFQMGSVEVFTSERPIHRVQISQVFEMGRYEVTQEQWKVVMGKNSSPSKGAQLPVTNVSWNEVQEFIKKKNEQNDGYIYRLPTEAEWEYACRAGSTGEYSGNIELIAWYIGNSRKTVHPVGQKMPNAWGLYDMQGNAWEWCQDWFGHDYYLQSPSVDPSGPFSGTSRVMRGGGWNSYDRDCRSANRTGGKPDYRYINLGFRLVRTLR